MPVYPSPFDSVPRLAPGDSYNLSWTKSAGTITISGDDAPLSTSRPGFVRVASAITPGTHVTLKVTADISFNDSDHASSDLTGWLFMSATGIAWSEYVPVFIVGLNKDDTDTGLKFGLSTNPRDDAFVTADIGYKGTVSSNNNKNSVFVIGSITESDYNNKPSTTLGATIMQKQTTANDWSIFISDDVVGFGNRSIDYMCSRINNFPTGQGGNASGKYFYDNGGTAPSGSTQAAKYVIDRLGNVVYTLSVTGGDLNGAGSVELRVGLPYAATSAGSMLSSGRGAIAAGATLIPILPEVSNNGVFANLYNTTNAPTTLQNVSFDQDGDYVLVTIRYKAY